MVFQQGIIFQQMREIFPVASGVEAQPGERNGLPAAGDFYKAAAFIKFTLDAAAFQGKMIHTILPFQNSVDFNIVE